MGVFKDDWIKETASTLCEASFDVLYDDSVAALRKAIDDGEILGLRRAIDLVLEVGTGHSDRTKNITDYIESHIRALERGASRDA